MGLVPGVYVGPANEQDRDGAMIHMAMTTLMLRRLARKASQ